MVTKMGVCRFCGQLVALELPEEIEFTEEELMETATANCKCPDAEVERQLKIAIDKANRNIDRCFKDEDVKRALKAAVSAVAQYKVESVTVKYGKGKKVEVKTGNTGRVQLKITTTEQEVME